MLVSLEGVDDLLEPLNHFRAHDVDRRAVDRDTQEAGRIRRPSRICTG